MRQEKLNSSSNNSPFKLEGEVQRLYFIRNQMLISLATLALAVGLGFFGALVSLIATGSPHIGSIGMASLSSIAVAFGLVFKTANYIKRFRDCYNGEVSQWVLVTCFMVAMTIPVLNVMVFIFFAAIPGYAPQQIANEAVAA